MEKNMDKIVTPWVYITGLLKKELVIEIYTIKKGFQTEASTSIFFHYEEPFVQ